MFQTKFFCIECQKNCKITSICLNTRTISGHLIKHQISKPVAKTTPTIQTTLLKSNVDLKIVATSQKLDLDKHLSLAIATYTASNRFCENKHFRKLLESLNPYYKVPSRNQISTNIQQIYEETFLNVKQKLLRLKNFL